MSVTPLHAMYDDDHEFNLGKLVREALDASSDIDPGQITALVLAKLDPQDLLPALETALRPYVRQQLIRRRVTLTHAKPSGRAPGRSWKGDAIRANWQEKLAMPYYVGGDHWKTLGECSYDDLMFAAHERMELARNTKAQAERLQGYAETIHTHGVATFSDLPEGVQKGLLSEDVPEGVVEGAGVDA